MQSGLSQTPGLRFIQHAKGAAHFQTKRRNTPDHFQNRVEFRTVVHLPPGRSHAKSGDSLFPRFARGFHHMIHGKQGFAFDSRLIVGALRAICAILGAAAGFDRQQLAQLYLAGLEVLPVRRLRRE